MEPNRRSPEKGDFWSGNKVEDSQRYPLHTGKAESRILTSQSRAWLVLPPARVRSLPLCSVLQYAGAAMESPLAVAGTCLSLCSSVRQSPRGV